MEKIALISALLISSFVTKAQSSSAASSQNVNMALSDAIEISFTATGTGVGNNVTLSFTSVTKYNNNVISSGQNIRIRSNKNFAVQVNSNSDNFSYTGTATPAPTMPVSSVLSVKVITNNTGGSVASPFTSYGYISSASQNIITNGARGGDQNFTVKYKATPGFSYPGGTYTVNIIYTATQL